MPLGIELKIDAANAFVVLIITGIASLVFPFGMGHKGLSGLRVKNTYSTPSYFVCAV